MSHQTERWGFMRPILAEAVVQQLARIVAKNLERGDDISPAEILAFTDANLAALVEATEQELGPWLSQLIQVPPAQDVLRETLAVMYGHTAEERVQLREVWDEASLDPDVVVLPTNAMTSEAMNDLAGVWKRATGRKVAKTRYRSYTEAMAKVLSKRTELPLVHTPPPASRRAELWTPGKRTTANLAAMHLMVEAKGRTLTAAERRVVARYSGWGGLSIRAIEGKVPVGFPMPEKRGLIHEYYTPGNVARAVVKALKTLVPTDKPLAVLEPSAGIGRFIEAGLAERLKATWTAVEYSEASALLLEARWPNKVEVLHGPFEQHIMEREDDWLEAFDVVLANPPYGIRGASRVIDPDHANQKMAYKYFIRRTLDVLRPGGVGVFVVPAGFMTGSTNKRLRSEILMEAHVVTAFRLPSSGLDGKTELFPGARLVTDLIFVRKREAPLAELPPEDLPLVAGEFFTLYPEHILGREVKPEAVSDDHTKAKPYQGYQVVGDFHGLPAFDERPVGLGVLAATTKRKHRRSRGRGGVGRTVKRARGEVAPEVQEAVNLGLRLDRFLALTQSPTGSVRAASMWDELVRDLESWKTRHGNPHSHAGLKAQAQARVTGAERMLAGFLTTGVLLEGLREKPKMVVPYKGAHDVLAVADWTWRTRGSLSPAELETTWRSITKRSLDLPKALSTLTTAGWCVDDSALVPRDVYLSGDLWPKLDRARALAARGDDQAKLQIDLLLRAISPLTWQDIAETLTPRDSWLPLDMVSEFVTEHVAKFHLDSDDDWARHPGSYHLSPVTLVRQDGLVTLASRAGEPFSYAALPRRKKDIPDLWSPYTLAFLGYANHDLALFKVPRRDVHVDGEKKKEPLNAAQVRYATAWAEAFVKWVEAKAARRTQLERLYNRLMRGYIAPSFTGEPVHVARWAPEAPNLYDYQARALRRILHQRRGLLAFDVGLGKTYTGIAAVARARQEGWANRPVVVVPNSIVWKWKRDFERVLPDYRVLVIGSTRKVVRRGARKGRTIATVDTPQERAAKWTQFQAGAADVVLLTYSALGRTKLDPETLVSYAEDTVAIQRQAALQAANARKKKGESERKEAQREERMLGWLAMHLEAPKGWEYDPGIAWDDLGVDFLMVDEAQNFKNLFMPEGREGGIPEGMGQGEASKRAWQLDFRCASVRARTGGSGVVLLSATPAKNSPLELYNLIHMVDPKAWTRVGITDPESFISRYCALEQRTVQAPTGKLEVRSAVTHFKNLHELRSVIFRYGDFKVAEDVGLKIPEATNYTHFVDLDADQTASIGEAFEEIGALKERLKKLQGQSEKVQQVREMLRLKMQGLAMGIDLLSLHAELQGTSKLRKRAILAMDPHSPKIDAVVKRVMDTSASACERDDSGCCFACGHIIFVSNIAMHYWIREALVKAGVPRERIAILNQPEAKDPETRQQIAEAFNGVGCPSDAEYTPPAFDIVIANQIAYEGVDLQRRTCAIHHVDLPWEPATLQQRNGRGVRQGNRFAVVAIHYYMARGSLDLRRLGKIQAKQSWMASLVKGQDRVTNNPGKGVEMSFAEIAAEVAPPEQRERFAAMAEKEAEAQAEAKAKRVRHSASGTLRKADERYRRAERTANPSEAARLREEADALLKGLARLDATAWPHLAVAQRIRTEPALLLAEGLPLFEGMHIRVGFDLCEVGQVRRGGVGLRSKGEAQWTFVGQDFLNEQDAKEGEENGVHIVQPWPDVIGTEEVVRLANYRTFDTLNPMLAGEAWLTQHWHALAPVVLARLQRSGRTKVTPYITPQGHLALTEPYQRVPKQTDVQLLPPSIEGWRRFLELAQRSGLAWTPLKDAGRSWFRRTIPRDLLKRAPEANAA